MIDERQPLQIGTRPLWLLLLNERDLTACARPTIALFLALFSKFGGHFVLFFKYYNRYQSLPHAHTNPNRLSLNPFVPVLYSLTPQPPPPACARLPACPPARLPACPPARLPRRQSFNGHLSRQVRDSPQLLIALAARQPVSPSAPAPTAPTARLSRPPFALLASPHEPAAVAWCPPTRTAPSRRPCPALPPLARPFQAFPLSVVLCCNVAIGPP